MGFLSKICLLLFLIESSSYEKHDDTHIINLSDENVNERYEHRYKRNNIEILKLLQNSNKLQCTTTFKPTQKVSVQSQSISIKNITDSITNQTVTRNNVTKTENLTGIFVDVFRYSNTKQKINPHNNTHHINVQATRYKRNVKSFKLPVPTVKVFSTTKTTVKTTTKYNPIIKPQSIPINKNTNTKSNVPIIQPQSIPINKNLSNKSSKPSNQTVLNITKIENVTSSNSIFIDVFRARIELTQNKTSNVTVLPKKKIPAYSPAINIFFSGLKIKDGCEYANCEPFAPADFRFKTSPTGIANISEGLILSKCSKSKTYFMSRETTMQTTIWEICCGLGMIPAVVETREEINCIYDAYQNYSVDFINTKKKKQNTFYINYSEIDIKRRYFIACPDKIEMPEDIWAEGQPDNVAGMQTTMSLNLNGTRNQTGLDDAQGQDILNYMCEIQVKPKKAKSSVIPYGPSIMAQLKNNVFEKYSCENKLKECRLLSKNAAYKFSDPKKVNISEGILITNCSSRRHFYLSNILLSSYNSHKLCCAIGMTPATIETRDEFNCIYNQFRTYSDKIFPKKIFTLAYFDEYFTRDFATCLDELDIPENMYAKDAPDNAFGNQNCMSAVLGGGFKTFDLGFNDVSCNDPYYVMCERIIPHTEKKMPPYSKYLREKYNETLNQTIKDICEESRCKGTKVAFDSAVLKKKFKPDDPGTYHAGCGNKVYFFSSIEIRATRMWNYCCNLGMVPATIQTRQEMLCIYSAYKKIALKDKRIKGKLQFFVSYMDFNLNYTYLSCPDKLEVPTHLWGPNTPDNLKGQESCVTVNFRNSKKLLGFNDVSCENNYFVLCEANYVTEKPTTTLIPEGEKTKSPFF